MRVKLQSHWGRLVVCLFLLGLGLALFLHKSTDNVMHPALDRLAAIPLSERWSHPEMLKIRNLGKEAIPALRAVLREKDRATTRLLLWVRASWPAAANYYARLPDPAQLSDRRWVACQALQTLGSTGKPAAPELVDILKGADLRDVNSATMALYAIGIDSDICDRLAALLEQEKSIPDGARSQIVGALGQVPSSSARTLQVLVASLGDPYPYVQYHAADALGRLQVRTPEIVSKLSVLQSSANEETVVIAASAALWELEKDPSLVLPRVLTVLKALVVKPVVPFPGGGNGGQAIESADQAFMAAGALFQRLGLASEEKSQALALLEAWAEKSDRIFIRMLLLPAMMQLGFPTEKCMEVCTTGLNASEDYYRLQAAKLLALACEKHPLSKVDLDQLLKSPEVGLRVYGAKVHWLKNRQAQTAVPILVEALDRSKHQSYSYAEVQPVAIQTLRDMGPAAQAAIGALESLSTDPNREVVAKAAEAISQIRR